MGDAWRKLIASTLICLVVAFGLVFLASTFDYTAKAAIIEFRMKWTVAKAWADFLTFVPVAVAWAVLITFSLAVPLRSSRLIGTSFEKFGSSIVVLVILTAMFSIAFGIAHPRAVSARQAIEYDSVTAQFLRDSETKASAEGNYEKALADLTRYAQIVGESDETAETLSQYRLRVTQDRARIEADQAMAREAVEPANAREFADRASAALEDEDYSSAHYLATIARSLDPDDEEAARIAAEALQRLEAAAPDDDERADAALFQSILAAKKAMDNGEVVTAYRLFRDLDEQHPGNADITRYFAEVSRAVRELAVFNDELEPVATTIGTASFSFVNRVTEEYTEIVSIGKLVRLNTGTYAQDVEMIRFDSSGRERFHETSDYGKLHGQAMILTISDRTDPGATRTPTILNGRLPLEEEGLLSLTPTPDELWLVGVASSDPASATIPDLVRIARTADQFGLLPEPIRAELLHRLTLPFLFLILNIVAMAFSWRYRSRYLASPPVVTYLLIPTAPLVLVPAYLLLDYGHRLLFSSLLLWSGFTVSMITLFAVEAVLLGASLTYLALSARE